MFHRWYDPNPASLEVWQLCSPNPVVLFVFSVCHFPFSAACLRHIRFLHLFSLSITANGSSRAVQAGFVFVLICFFPYTHYSTSRIWENENTNNGNRQEERGAVKGYTKSGGERGFFPPFFCLTLGVRGRIHLQFASASKAGVNRRRLTPKLAL